MSRDSKLIVFVAVLASLLEIIDTSIVNVAIPTMMGSLGATFEDMSMVVTGYAIANAIVLPLSAWLADRIGRRRYYLGCIGLFVLTSLLCGIAPNLWTLVVFRILQGLAGGALLPTSQALIYEQFPKEKAGMAGAIFGMSVMIGPTLGPTLGGYLTDNFGWRSIFNINLPLGLLALFMGFLVIKSSEKSVSASNKIDSVGLGLLAVGIGCLQYVLERGEADDWFSSGTILACSLIAAFSLPFFIWWELRVPYPIINIRLFKDRIVACGVALMGFLGFFLYGLVLVLPYFVSSTLRYDATQTGMLFIPGSLITAFLMPFVGKSMQRTDPRVLIATGFVCVELCIFMLSQFSSASGESQILHALYLRGLGMAFLFVPINSSILSQFKGLELGQVAGLLNLSRQIGGAMGIALVGTLLNINTKQNYVDLVSHVSMLEPATQAAYNGIVGGMTPKLLESVGAATPHIAALKALSGRVYAQAFMLSFNQLMITIGLIFLVAFIPLAMLRFRKTVAAVADAH